MATTTVTATATTTTSEVDTAASGVIESIVLDSSSSGSFTSAHHFAIHNSTFFDVSGNVENFKLDIHYDNKRGLNLLYPAIAATALFDSSERCSASMQLPDVHQALLLRLQQWIENPQPEHRILLVSGPANTGKSLLSQTLAQYYQDGEPRADGKRFAAASFLFPSGKDKTVESNQIIPTLAYQFAYSNPAVTADIVQPVYYDETVLKRNMSTQLKTLVIGPLEKDKLNRRFSISTPIPIIIDGLDSWAAGYEKQKELMDVIKKAVSGNLPFRFVIFTRMEGNMKEILQRTSIQIISGQIQMDDQYKFAMESRLKRIKARAEERLDINVWGIARRTGAKIVAIRGFIGKGAST